MSHAQHERQYAFTMARFERWALPCLARSLPKWVMPDHLTMVGVLSATAIFGCYVATNLDHRWFWVASALLVIHWFGDSLDGTLARERKTERPRYGYYLDHITDAYATAVICIGLGMTSVMHFSAGAALALMYLVLSINVYLETHVMKRFRIGYGRLGPTEGRILLIVLNTAAAIFGAENMEGIVLGATVFDLVAIAGALLMCGLLVVRVVANLRHLGKEEPPGVVRS